MSGSNISREFPRLLRIDTPTVPTSLSFVENVTVFVPLSRTFRVLFGETEIKSTLSTEEAAITTTRVRKCFTVRQPM